MPVCRNGSVGKTGRESVSSRSCLMGETDHAEENVHDVVGGMRLSARIGR